MNNFGRLGLRSTDFPSAPLTYSVARELCARSPLHAATASSWWRQRLGLASHAESESMAWGTEVHEAIMFGLAKYAIFSGDKRTKVGKAQWDEIVESGKTPIKPYDLEALKAICESAWRVLPAFTASDCELDLAWEESDDIGRQCQCLGKIDILLRDCIIDIKTCRDASPERMAPKHIDLGYDLQEHAYRAGAAANGLGNLEFVFLFVETEAPYATCLVEYSESMRRHGELRWELAKLQWCERNQREVFPDYGRATLEAPEWAIRKLVALDADRAMR